MQSLLDHNTSRIFEDDDIVEQIERLAAENDGELEIFKNCKLGFDGTSLNDIGKSKHSTVNSERDEGHLMTSHLVCMNMVAFDKNGQCHIIYCNSQLNSSVSCRPLRYLFKKVRNYNITRRNHS